MTTARNSQIWRAIPLLIAICFVSISPQGLYGSADDSESSAQTSRYIFLSDQSTLVQTGGIAGVHWTYSIEGQFVLTVDFDAGKASFAQVDANAIDDSPWQRTLDPNEVFTMTTLVGTVLSDTTLEFTGKSDNGSDVRITATIQEDLVHLVAETVPPPNSADFFIFNMDAAAQRKYGGGTGEPNDPYQIATAEDLMLLGETPEDYDKHFILTADIDLEPNLPGRKVFDKAVIASATGVFDINGFHVQGIPFAGVFDGNGRMVTHLTIRGKDYLGLFGQIVDGAEVKNLGVVDVNIVGQDDYVGGLVALSNWGTVTQCYSAGALTGAHMVGGLIGKAEYSIIRNCFSYANVNGTTSLGGLVGLCRNDTAITCCGATGTVNGTGFGIGGLIGRCGYKSDSGDCVIASSFASGDVSGDTQIGGLVGMLSYSQIICSYASGSVSGISNYVGGLVGGLNVPRIIDSYATGRVSGTGTDVGGFSGDDWRPAYDCFWDTEASGMSTSGLGTGLTTLQMQDPNTFLGAGWDFVGETANGPSDIWIMPEGGGYPILSWQASPLPPLPNFSGGTGEPNNPYLISTAEELNSIGHNPRLMSAHFMLTNDVNLAGIEFFLIGHEGYPFSGVFDGNGYRITNFSHKASNKYRQNIGLFGYVRDSAGEIINLILTKSSLLNNPILDTSGDTSRPKNVGLLVGLLYEGTLLNCDVEDSNVSVPGTMGVQNNENIGGLIGYNMYGLIEGCSSSANVQGNHAVGGLLGFNFAGIIWDCHSSGDVYGPSPAGGPGGIAMGGLVGENWALIEDCSASGNVSGWSQFGGLVGDNLSTINASCSYGDVVGSGLFGSDNQAGGLVGWNIGHISNCYARGWVLADEKVGGLVGENTYHPFLAGSIVTSYSTGFVYGNKDIGGLAYRGSTYATTSDDCFWDVETSGQTESDGGIGKTTAEMKSVSTFTDAGWDFIGETVNGTEDIWWIDEGRDYPRLWWELIPEN